MDAADICRQMTAGLAAHGKLVTVTARPSLEAPPEPAAGYILSSRGKSRLATQAELARPKRPWLVFVDFSA